MVSINDILENLFSKHAVRGSKCICAVGGEVLLLLLLFTEQEMLRLLHVRLAHADESVHSTICTSACSFGAAASPTATSGSDDTDVFCLLGWYRGCAWLPRQHLHPSVTN